MRKNTFEDFSIGDEVYHLSNTKIMMVCIETDESRKEIICRWLNEGGQIQRLGFLPHELGRKKDLKFDIIVGKNNNKYKY